MSSSKTLLRPRALRPGDKVAIVAPSSRYDAERMEHGAAVLESWGLSVERTPAREPHRYLAASDHERAAELTSAFERDDVAAVMAVRGGYGAARLTGLFDPAVAAAHPKIFLGYSDVTILLARLVAEAGLVCFHGPMASSDLARLDDARLERFRRFLFGEDGWWDASGLAALAPGRASGRLAGGCMSVIATTIGTSYEVDTRGSVLFLEDINEAPYKVDRLLTQLVHAGKLDDVAAVVLGEFHGCDTREQPGQVLEICSEILGRLGIPVVAGMDAGHYSGQVVLPIGCRVEVDAGAGTVQLLEPVLADQRPASSAGPSQSRAAR